ncbi:MAG: signal peptidase I [Planctomycetes bacterium]|nr:signal peptidase I [Planctomycetota bacterium]MCW8135383.1 signal peptidase I [Planctomycetota bacterium]
MDKAPRRITTALLACTPVALCTLLLALTVLPDMPGLAPFVAGWWVLSLGMAGMRWSRAWLPPLLVLPLALPPLVLTMAVNFRAVKVQGHSMQPTFQPGDVLLVDQTATPDRELGVYVLEVEGESHNPLIKRLAGMPGRTVAARYHRLFSDDFEVHPRTGTPPDTWNTDRPLEPRWWLSQPLKLADNEYFFVGDNPPDSRDSREFGPVGREAVKGRVVWSLKGSRGFGPAE